MPSKSRKPRVEPEIDPGLRTESTRARVAALDAANAELRERALHGELPEHGPVRDPAEPYCRNHDAYGHWDEQCPGVEKSDT